VTDIERSRAFCDNLFGLPVAFEVSADADEATREPFAFFFGGVIYDLGTRCSGCAHGEDSLDKDRVGLDHDYIALELFAPKGQVPAR